MNKVLSLGRSPRVLLVLAVAVCGELAGCRRSPPAEPAAVGSGEGSQPAFEAFAGSGGSGAAAPDAIPADAAAIVNGQAVLTKTELDAALAEIVERYERLPEREPTTSRWRNERRRRLVQSAVHDRLIAAHVAASAPVVTDEQLTQFVRDEIGEVFDDERLFERFLQSHEQTREEYLAERRNELAEQLVLAQRGSIEPTDAEIDEFYQRNSERWRAEDRVNARVITVRVRANATPEQEAEARARVEALRTRVTSGGEDFAEVARSSSESADRIRGGDLGWVARGRRPELAASGVEQVLFTEPVGSVTAPQRTQLGFQIFQILDRRDAGVRQMDEVRETIYEPLRRRRIDRLRMELVEELMRTATVEYREVNWGLEPETDGAVAGSGAGAAAVPNLTPPPAAPAGGSGAAPR